MSGRTENVLGGSAIRPFTIVGSPVPSDLSDDERRTAEALGVLYPYAIGIMMALRPQTLCGLIDSPVFLAAFMLDHDPASLEMITRAFDGQQEGLTRDDVLDNITLYWLTKTGVSASRLYGEHKGSFSPSRTSPCQSP
jgi:hypothetical protein